MIETISSVELARLFYTEHELLFQRAIQVEKTEERGFDYSSDQFDDWAVKHGWMDNAARNAAGVERDGLTQQRLRLRRRLNSAARTGVGLARAFSIEAGISIKAGEENKKRSEGRKWRVDLSERFVFERPTTIIHGLRSTFYNAEGQIGKTRKLVRGQTHLSDEDRGVLLANLSMASMFIFNNLQTVEMIAHMAVSGKTPDFRALYRKVTQSMSGVQTPPTRKSTKKIATR